jgi:uncharacterized membrane protein YfcA
MEFIQSEPLLLPGLSFLGFCVGFLTGMFGIGGAFITTPVMILAFGISPTTAVGCSMGFTLVNGGVGLKRHRGLGNFEPKAMWPLAIFACVGTFTGFRFHHSLADAWGDQFDTLVNGMFCVILLPISFLVWWQSDKSLGKPLLSRLRVPPMIRLNQKELPLVSATLLASIGLTIGVFKGMLGIGGGIILVPLLILIVGMTPHRAVGTSLGMVVFSSVIGTLLFAIDGSIDYVVVLAMLVGSLIGVLLGTRSCNILPAVRLKRLLSILIFCFSLFLAYEVVKDIVAVKPDSEGEVEESADALPRPGKASTWKAGWHQVATESIPPLPLRRWQGPASP